MTAKPESANDAAPKPSTMGEALALFQRKAHDALALGRDAEGQIQSRTYKYLTLDKMNKQVVPLLSECGLIWLTLPVEQDGKAALEYRLIFAAEPLQVIQGVMLLMLPTEANSQAQGSAITYARRQALACVLNLVPDDDDDAAAAVKGDERLIVSRTLTVDETARMREAFAEAGVSFDEAMATVEVDDAAKLTLGHMHQLRAILRMHGGAES